MLKEWASNVRSSYKNVLIEENVDPNYEPKGVLFVWNEDRLLHISVLRQRALTVARENSAGYIFVSVCISMCY